VLFYRTAYPRVDLSLGSQLRDDTLRAKAVEDIDRLLYEIRGGVAASVNEGFEVATVGVEDKFGARPRNQRFAGRTLILAPHTVSVSWSAWGAQIRPDAQTPRFAAGSYLCTPRGAIQAFS